MIKLTDIDGKAFYLAPRAIAQITPAPIACRHHGLKATVETFAGRQWGVQQAPEEIVAAMSEDKSCPAK